MHSAIDQQHKEADEREYTGEAKFLSKRGRDIVGIGERHNVALAQAKAAAEYSPIGKSNQALNDLIPGGVGNIDRGRLKSIADYGHALLGIGEDIKDRYRP